jgi:rhomboid protease GluP
MRRQAIRARFFLNQSPGFVTNVIIAVVVAMYLFSSMIPAIYFWGGFDPNAILVGQVWRFVTSIFIYPPGPEHLLGLLFNVLSLFFVGRAVEIFYGPYRYLSIYVAVGVLSNIAFLLFFLFIGHLFVLNLGPLASLLGVFGAIGVFYFANRRGLGVFGTSAITSWLFWLVLNLALSLSNPIIIGIEIFCIIVGMIVAYFLLPRSDSGRGRSLF